MGIKGEKNTADSVQASSALVKQLAKLGDVSAKKMFGGHGIFHEGKMFGIVDSKGKPFFKVDDSTRAGYEKLGAEKHGKMPYYAVPAPILNDDAMFLEWAQQAITVSKK